jgi:hypothetical protein
MICPSRVGDAQNLYKHSFSKIHSLTVLPFACGTKRAQLVFLACSWPPRVMVSRTTAVQFSHNPASASQAGQPNSAFRHYGCGNR